MKMAQQTALGKSEAAITAALKNVYFAAKNDLANSMVPELNNLCLKQGVSQISDLKVDAHTTYEHHSSIGCQVINQPGKNEVGDRAHECNADDYSIVADCWPITSDKVRKTAQRTNIMSGQDDVNGTSTGCEITSQVSPTSNVIYVDGKPAQLVQGRCPYCGGCHITRRKSN
ncbi:uncharacterized protein LOC123537389 isoform X3 [Mercenaria mercenaria]|uniref:uncharacterized protein LOC123537389 isoform X3 n=1 Tax=Mercenaria mercenaria TaxID=6596 RepID=UPI00234E5F52|nr:uncharacterized protein LOC123537389 isoform X3 [Mercenaria mercenaria]